MRLTDPVGEAGQDIAGSFYVQVEETVTPLEILADLVGGSLHAQLEDLNDDHQALMLELLDDNGEVLSDVFSVLSSVLATAIDTTLAVWRSALAGPDRPTHAVDVAGAVIPVIVTGDDNGPLEAAAVAHDSLRRAGATVYSTDRLHPMHAETFDAQTCREWWA